MSQNAIKAFKQKTVLVKRTWERVIVDVPFEKIKEAMKAQTLVIWRNHIIRTSAINEYYELNMTNEVDLFIEEEFPDISEEITRIVAERRRNGMRVTKAIVTNIAALLLVKDS